MGMRLSVPCCLLLACASGPAPREIVGSGAALSLQVDALAPGALQPVPVPAGGAVQNGEGIALTAWVDHPAHLYVVHYSPDGWSQLLYPAAEELKVAAGERVRVPAGGRRLTVGGTALEEVLYVFSSPTPILRAMPDFCGRYRLYCPEGGRLALERGDASDPPKPPPPPPIGTRPNERSPASAGPEQVVTARAGRGGVAVIRFRLRHRR